MTSYREGRKLESNKPRSTRFEYRDGEWFFSTREGIELGPFESHAEAAVSLNEYLEFIGSGNAQALVSFYNKHAA